MFKWEEFLSRGLSLKCHIIKVTHPSSCNLIAQYKVPVTFFFVEQYTLTASGKVQKFRLRETANETLAKENR